MPRSFEQIDALRPDAQLLERAQEQADRFGTHRYLGKPFDLGEMLEVVKDLVGTA